MSDLFTKLMVVKAFGKRQSFSQRVKGLFGANLVAYWPLDEASGTTAYDISGNNRHAAYTDVTLGQPGIGDGKTAALLNGTSSKINLKLEPTTGYNCFPKTAGTFMCYTKIAAAEWIDGQFRALWHFIGSSGNQYIANKATANNKFQFNNTTAQTCLKDNWFCVLYTWDTGANVSKLFIDGVQLGANHTTLPFTNFYNSYIGMLSAGTNFFKGHVAHAVLANRVATPAEISSLVFF